MTAPLTTRLRDTTVQTTERNVALWIHLTPLLGFFLMGPFAPVVPLCMWLGCRKSSPFDDDHGREVLNMLITGAILFGIGAVTGIGMVLWPIWAVVEWASVEGVRSFPTAFRVGEPLRPTRPLWIDEGSLEIERPGRIDRVAVKAGRLLSPPAAEPGFVRISGSGRSEEAAVNLFDAEESDLRAPSESPPGPPLPPPAPWHARIPYAVLAVAGVLALLLLEGWLYHRGTI